MAATEEWISITEAATRLTTAGDPIDRSTLSRYLKQHAEALPLTSSGKANLVEFHLLRAHRAENIRLRPLASQRVPPRAPVSRFAGSQSDGTARKVQADAELREMDLAVRRRQLTPVAEVDQAGRDAVALMQSAFDRAIDTEAASFSLKYGWDERTARIALKSFSRRGLDVFHRELLDRLDNMRRAEESGEPALRSDQSALQ